MVFRVTRRPAAPVGVKQRFAVRISFHVIQVAIEPVLVTFIRHVIAMVRHVDQEILHLPGVAS